ncbi:hypothetical protein [Bacillus massiliigorillae]|uniref:hypothetical protein n=1 Tax=Bacillus massiliigorillae TaxID=1243664 RepID=UPI00039F99F8|nr:hypothetical protein [Bacillus massiliigorillae]
MNGYILTEGHEYRPTYLSHYSKESTIHQPLRIGLWHNGTLSWKYPHTTDLEDYSDSFFSVSSLNCTPDYEITKIQLNNNTNERQHLKIIIEYDHASDAHSTAFYSPSENAIVGIAQNNITMLGGMLSGRGMSQYCVQKKNYFSSFALLRSLENGNLPLSWLANGDIYSMFILETEICSGVQEEGIIWTFTSSSAEKTKALKNEKITKYL